jgi:O-antigen ligase
VLLLFYCVLQYLQLDEFFKGISDKDELVGTIGNPRHLAGLLAICQPLFFEKKRENIFILVLLWLIIILADSATGLVAAFLVLLFWLFFKNKKLFFIILSVSSLSVLFLYLFNKSFFYNSARLEVWLKTLGFIKTKFITGFGLGAYDIMNLKRGLVQWRHAHNEYIQLIYELGVVGLVLVFWGIYDYFKNFAKIRTDLSIRFASIFFGYCLLCGVTFFGHLWQTSVIGILSYAGLYVIKNGVDNADKT